MKGQLTVWNFWLWWILASDLGFLAGSLLGVLPFVLLKLFQQTTAFEAVSGMFIGGGIALGQWLVLRRSLPITAAWILTGVVGLGIANTIGAAFCICLAGVVYPLITAGLQVLILLKLVPMPWLWVIVGIVGALLGGSINELYHGASWTAIAYVTASSAVTGFALMRLIKLKN